jgi:hypothetical protein
LTLAEGDEVPFVESVFTEQISFFTPFQHVASYTVFLMVERTTTVDNHTIL